jgi:hypothetical protein
VWARPFFSKSVVGRSVITNFLLLLPENENLCVGEPIFLSRLNVGSLPCLCPSQLIFFRRPSGFRNKQLNKVIFIFVCGFELLTLHPSLVLIRLQLIFGKDRSGIWNKRLMIVVLNPLILVYSSLSWFFLVCPVNSILVLSQLLILDWTGRRRRRRGWNNRKSMDSQHRLIGFYRGRCGCGRENRFGEPVRRWTRGWDSYAVVEMVLA